MEGSNQAARKTRLARNKTSVVRAALRPRAERSTSPDELSPRKAAAVQKGIDLYFNGSILEMVRQALYGKKLSVDDARALMERVDQAV